MIESELYTHLRDTIFAVSERIYPQIMPQGCVKPAIVYTIVSDVDYQALSGCVSDNIIRIQIDVYALEDLEARQIRNAVKESLYSFGYYPIDLNTMDGFEEEHELFRQIIDFKIRK